MSSARSSPRDSSGPVERRWYKSTVPSIQPSRTRVLHFPDWRGANPYQRLLAAALGRQAVDVAFATYAGALLPLTRNVLEQRPQILHLHWIAEIAGLTDDNLLRSRLKQILFRLDVAIVRRLLRGRLVWTAHNLRSHENRNLTADCSTRRFLARQVAYLLAHGPAASAAVVADYGVTADRVVLAHHGHFIGVYRNDTTKAESRQRLAIPDDRFVFLCFGDLRPYKGVDDLIASFTQLAEPRTLLVVAGRASDPGYAEILRRRASLSDVTFVDRFIPDESVQWFFNASDVVVLPFREILTSGSLLLAMSFGRMVVAPRLGCVPDYVDPLCNVIYEPAVPDALTDALRATLTRDVDACGRSNLEAVRRFDWDDSAARTAAVYRNLVAH